MLNLPLPCSSLFSLFVFLHKTYLHFSPLPAISYATSRNYWKFKRSQPCPLNWLSLTHHPTLPICHHHPDIQPVMRSSHRLGYHLAHRWRLHPALACFFSGWLLSRYWFGLKYRNDAPVPTLLPNGDLVSRFSHASPVGTDCYHCLPNFPANAFACQPCIGHHFHIFNFARGAHCICSFIIFSLLLRPQKLKLPNYPTMTDTFLSSVWQPGRIQRYPP